MRTLFFLALFAAGPALAVPTSFHHQGHMADSAGTPLEGPESVTFRLFDASSGGLEVWSETQQVDFTNGYFAVDLGDDGSLDSNFLDSDELWLELTVGTGSAIPDRIRLHAVPYALRAQQADHALTADSATSAESAETATTADTATTAGTATNISGGTVDATSISVNGNVIVDGSGNLQNVSVEWSDITGVPSSVLDDNDTLAGITCSNGQVLGWQGGWGCADPSTYTDADALAAVTQSNRFVRADQSGSIQGVLQVEGVDLQGTGQISGIAEPTDDDQAATKAYVDDAVASSSTSADSIFWWASVSLGTDKYTAQGGVEETLTVPGTNGTGCSSGGGVCVYNDGGSRYQISFAIPTSVDDDRDAPEFGNLMCWATAPGDNEPGLRSFTNAVERYATDMNGGHTHCNVDNSTTVAAGNSGPCLGLQTSGIYSGSHTTYGVVCVK